MKRYLVFCGWNYYPGGGGNDFYFATDDLEEANEKCEEYKNKQTNMIGYIWSHIFDNETLEIL